MTKQASIVALLICCSTAAHATTFNEIGDAGSTFTTAQAVADGTTVISGFLDHTTDQFITDMFAFSLVADTTLTITGNEAPQPDGSLRIDPVLFLIDDQRNLLVADDDGGSVVNAQITTSLLAGDYFVAIGDFGTGAFASFQDFRNGNPFADPFIGTLVGPFSDQVALIGTDDGPFSDDESGAYSISFSTAVDAGTVAPVPLPASLPMLLVAFGGLGFAAKRRRQNQN